MKKLTKLQGITGIVLLLTLVVSLLYAAEQPQRGQQGPGRMQRGGGFDRAAMTERMMGMMQERMGASEEEWKIISPRLSKVMELSQDANSRGMGMFRGMSGRNRGRRGPDTQDQQAQNESPVQKAIQGLQETLEKENASSDEIKSKLEALRSAREKARQELAKAQQSLREVLTLKQEAQLILMGMLD